MRGDRRTSGIGKSTIVERALDDLDMRSDTVSLSARVPDDIKRIDDILRKSDFKTLIIDDFHRLDDTRKRRLADKMKVIADSPGQTSKLILVGINKAGDRLVNFAPDLAMRIDIFRLESNPSDKIVELVSLGERALNVTIGAKSDIVDRAQGSFQIAQVLCYNLCAREKIESTQVEHLTLNVSIEVTIERVMEDLGRQFGPACLAFARGSKLRPEGRAPYLHILRWMADAADWSLDLNEELRQHPEQRTSVGQVIEKKFLARMLTDPEKKALLEPHFHYDDESSTLSVEDPKLIFYLKNLVWKTFTRKVGFAAEIFKRPYDFALSFAGSDRPLAARLRELLAEREIAVFYDLDEQHRILAENVEDYLVPIYRTEALFVIPILSPFYPTRIWAKIESDAFKERFGKNAVIPIRLSSVAEGFFNSYMDYGYLSFDEASDIDVQLQQIAETLSKRLLLERNKSK